jgi:hypothetical protein
MATIIDNTAKGENKNMGVNLPFGKKNYILMIVGVAMILLGFFLMSLESEPYGFGTLSMTIAPIFILGGFVVEFFAILKKPSAQ